jgi:hypothetical protein
VVKNAFSCKLNKIVVIAPWSAAMIIVIGKEFPGGVWCRVSAAIAAL